jgi:hypothetical protein
VTNSCGSSKLILKNLIPSEFIAAIMQTKLGRDVIKMKKRLLVKTVLAGLFISLVACNDTNNQAGPGSSSKDDGSEKPNEMENTPVPMNFNGQIAFAKQDLAGRMGVDLELVKLSSAEAATWRSGALGCPEPGKMYTEALVPGSVIYLQVDNMIHAYHAKFAGEPFYCPRERVESPVLEEGVDHT